MAAKTRFTSQDVTAMVRELGSPTGLRHLRVSNIFDIDEKTYLFKFAGEKEKFVLLIESGIRFHTTSFQRAKSEFPSPFAMKLRKHIRTKRLESISQPVRGDRLVQMTFGSGPVAVHVLLEFYANGNLILTDANYEILALLRSHQFDEAVAIKVGEIYPVKHTLLSGSVTSAGGGEGEAKGSAADAGAAVAEEGVGAEKSPGEAGGASGIRAGDVPSFISWARGRDAEHELWLQTAGQKKNKKMMLKQLLLSKDSDVGHFGPEILEHVCLSVGLAPSLKVSALVAMEEEGEESQSVLAALLAGLNAAEQLSAGEGQGYCFFTTSAASATAFSAPASPASDADDVAVPIPVSVDYTEFSSVLLKQHEGKERTIFSTFCQAVDSYYFKIEAGAQHKKQHAAENAALKKLSKVKSEAQNHVKKLEATQTSKQKAASLVTKHAENIDKCILVLKSALDSGMAWRDVEEMVAAEAGRGNPIASMVKSMRLEKSRVVLQLPSQDDSDGEYDDDDDDDDEEEQKVETGGKKKAPQFVDVDISLLVSAHANARSLYIYKKAATQKQLQTIESSSRAVAAVESATLKTIEGQKHKQQIREARKIHWFERFHWFVSSDGHLVLSGKDAQQNEVLVKRYLRKGDVYVHAEVHGAASCVVRRKQASASAGGGDGGGSESPPISPSALQEAGQACVCRSHAWAHKQIASAYWVHAEQVSKAAPSGEYLSTGSFMIYGKKNFLPPLVLEMGFGVVFRLDDASVARHARGGGRVREEDEESYVSMLDRYGLDEGGAEAGEGPELEAVEEEEEDGEELGGEEDEEEEGEVGGDERKEALGGRDEGAGRGEGVGVDEDAVAGDEDDEEDEEEEAEDEPHLAFQKPPSSSSSSSSSSKAPAPDKRAKHKQLSKKKARRYAEQDDEDRALALQALGHAPPPSAAARAPEAKAGEAGGDKGSAKKTSKSGTQRAVADTATRQQRAGVSMLTGDGSQFDKAVLRLHVSVRALLLSVMEGEGAAVQPGEIGAEEILALASFAPDDAVKILHLFFGEEGANLQRKGHKGAFLAGVMRRFAKEGAAAGGGGGGAGGGEKDGRARADKEGGGRGAAARPSSAASASASANQPRPPAADDDVAAIMAEEGIWDEEEGRAADELDKLSGMLLPGDVVLYAVPVCGPYACMRDFKYKVKLTPGVMKKGKVFKTSVDAWTKQRECGDREKALLRGLSDPECVAVLLGDCRVAMPGLHLSSGPKKAQRGQKGKSTRGM